MLTVLNFKIESNFPISAAFMKEGIRDFHSASTFIRDLKYGRNKNKFDLLSVFKDRRGTCSTKHAILKELAQENSIKDISLMLGIFKMNTNNTPVIAHVLRQHMLDYIPEAHVYLKVHNTILDCTKSTSSAEDFEHELLYEAVIETNQITSFKNEFHRNYLRFWLISNPQIQITLDELWTIRENCIMALCNY